MHEQIKILIADDHFMVRQGIIKCLNTLSGFLFVGEAADGQEAIEKNRLLNPDIILMDINMPKINGIDAAKAILKEKSDRKILVLTAIKDDINFNEFLNFGIKGYILKNTKIEDLAKAIHIIHEGGTFFDPEVKTNIEGKNHIKNNKTHNTEIHLTPKEIDILKFLTEGFNVKEIAEKMSVSIKTIDSHRENMKEKLNINSTIGLVRYAIERGIVKLKS